MSDKVSIDWLREQLKLADAPSGIAYYTILYWAGYDDGICLYYDGDLVGVKDGDVEFIQDYEDDAVYPLALGCASRITGTKRLRSFWATNPPPNLGLCVLFGDN